MADHFVLPLASFRLISLRVDADPDRFVFDGGAAFEAAMIQLAFYHLEKLVDIVGRTDNLLYAFERHVLIVSQVVKQLVVFRRLVQERIDKQFVLFDITFGNKRVPGQEDGFEDRQIVLCLFLLLLFFRLVGYDQQVTDMPELPVVQSDPFHHQVFDLTGEAGVVIPGIAYAIEIVGEGKAECFLSFDLIKNFLRNGRILEQVDS